MGYIVRDHRLVAESDQDRPVVFHASPNHGAELVRPSLLVMHYTAGRSAQSAATWLCSPHAGASAHLIIGKAGDLIQLVPFNLVAWHAGKSSWQGREAVNKFSIGIELDNPGRIVRKEDHWRSLALGTDYPAGEGVILTHKAEHAPCGWHVYPPEQLDVAFEVASLLVRTYGLTNVVGHEDVAPGRKSDPGPAFAMDSFRSKLFGRTDDAIG
jgi:N-acetylmuramoyl-L-alanine amidase